MEVQHIRRNRHVQIVHHGNLATVIKFFFLVSFIAFASMNYSLDFSKSRRKWRPMPHRHKIVFCQVPKSGADILLKVMKEATEETEEISFQRVQMTSEVKEDKEVKEAQVNNCSRYLRLKTCKTHNLEKVSYRHHV